MSEHKSQQTVQGIVEKISSMQTIRVSTKITKLHPLYRKRYSQVKHYLVHDPKSSAKVGDMVTIAMCKPVSKSKYWTLLEK